MKFNRQTLTHLINFKNVIMKAAGIVLIVIGILMIVYNSFNFKTKEKVVDLGPVEINKEKNHSVEWPPIVGGIFIVGGIAAIVMDRKK